MDIYHLDTGVEIHLDCKVDVSSAQEKKIIFKKPDGTIVEKTAEQGEDNNHIKYVIPTTGSPIDVEGTYRLRSKIKFNSSQEQQGDPVSLLVGRSWTAG